MDIVELFFRIIYAIRFQGKGAGNFFLVIFVSFVPSSNNLTSFQLIFVFLRILVNIFDMVFKFHRVSNLLMLFYIPDLSKVLYLLVCIDDLKLGLLKLVTQPFTFIRVGFELDIKLVIDADLGTFLQIIHLQIYHFVFLLKGGDQFFQRHNHAIML